MAELVEDARLESIILRMAHRNLAGRSSEEAVTRRTRNAVVRKGTWVRIPPSPPYLIRTHNWMDNMGLEDDAFQ